MPEPKRKVSRSTDVSRTMDDILNALDHIREHMPNGELKIIQEKVEAIETNQEKLKEDLTQIKKLLLDPESGLVVRVNKNTDFREENEKSIRDKFETLNEINRWKEGVNKALWVIFAALIGLVVETFFRK